MTGVPRSPSRGRYKQMGTLTSRRSGKPTSLSSTSRITASFLAGELLLWLLQRLEQLTSATFRESELTNVSPSQFRALVRQGLLVYQQKDPEQQRFPRGAPR